MSNRIEDFENAKDDWDFEGANRFSPVAIRKVKAILELLKSPTVEMFPLVGRGDILSGIQLEWENEDRSKYFELEIWEDHESAWFCDNEIKEKFLNEIKEDKRKRESLNNTE